MSTQFQVIDREMAVRGACYLICRAYDESDFSAALAALVSAAFSRGALQVWVSCLDEAGQLPLEGFDAGSWHFSKEAEYSFLYKDLTAASAAHPRLTTKPLRPGNAELFRDLYNEAFFSVQNASTLGRAETDAILSDSTRSCGFFMEGGMPVGVYELSFREDIPEIAALCISPALQRRGYGRRALVALEEQLRRAGYGQVQLLVSSKNEAALSLYRAAQYGGAVRHSTWYRTEAK